MSTPDLGSLSIELPILLETRLLLQANSGAGKSHALRRILEQTAFGVQQLVIDPDGEFATLRERFDYIVCAPHGADAVATPQTAAALASALWKAGTSAILDIYELKAHERILFVRRFIDALINAPRSVWHPTLVAIDEIQIFAPQTGSAESLSAVIDLATRGRKRGLALLGATQRLSKLNKDVAAECLNKLIGRTGLDVDVKRAADELGLVARDATETLRNLEPGEFFAFGPALSRAVVRTRIGPVETTHPQSGQRAVVAPPPASSKVKAQLAKIEGLQREAADEAKTVESLSAELAKVRRELTIAQKVKPAVEQVGHTDAQVQALIAAERETSQRELEKMTVPLAKIRDLVMAALGEGFNAMLREAPAAPIVYGPAPGALATEAGRKRAVDKMLERSLPKGVITEKPATGLTGPEQRIVDAIAWMESIGVDQPEQPAVAFLAGYSYGGGSYNNPRSRLNQRGLISYLSGNKIGLTDEGRKVANAPPAIASNEELHRRILERLGGPEKRVLTPLLAAYPSAMANADLAAAAGYAAGAGSFNNPRSRLRTFGLVDYPQAGHVAARAMLFPKGI